MQSGPTYRRAIRKVIKAVYLDWINNQACHQSQNIYVITNIFITNNYLFEMTRKIIFTNYFSEFIHQVAIISDSERPCRRSVFNPTLYLDIMSKCRR